MTINTKRFRAIVEVDGEYEIMKLDEAAMGPEENIDIVIAKKRGVLGWSVARSSTTFFLDDSWEDEELTYHGPLGRKARNDPPNAIIMIYDPKNRDHAKLAKKLMDKKNKK